MKSKITVQMLWGWALAVLCWPLGLAIAAPVKPVDWTQSTFSGKSRSDALSDQEWATYLSDRLHVRGLMKSDTLVSLDFSDPRVFRFIVARLKLAGKTPQSSPHLFQLINQRRAQGGKSVVTQFSGTRGWQHTPVSTNFLAPGSPYMEANAVSTYPGGVDYGYVDAAAYDQNGNPLGDMGYGEIYGGATVWAAALGDTSQGSDNHVEADTYSLIEKGSTLLDSYVVRANNSQCQIDTTTLTVNDPVDKGGSQCIDICLNRTWTGDCDYDLTGTTWALKIPLSGSISITTQNPNCVFDSATIAGYRNGTLAPPGNIKVLLDTVGGGCDVQNGNQLPYPMQSFWANTTLSTDNKTLSWNMTGANAAIFDSSCRQVQDQVYLIMTLVLPYLQGTAKLVKPIVISNDPNSQVATYRLPCITETNSCLAEGTKIEMADGRVLPIESIQKGDRTFNPFQPDLLASTVVDTAQGVEPVPMVRISDAAGRSLLLTEMHPIATVDHGMVQARRLKVGELVKTKTGPSRLVSVTRESFSGKVHNLKVGTDEEAPKLGVDQTVVYANGFMVGDGQIQQKYESADQHALAKSDVRKRLPAAWLRDYVNSATR